MKSIKRSLVIFLFLLAACTVHNKKGDPQLIKTALENRGFQSIDFSKIGNKAWTKVCFLGPYTQDASKVLGFSWELSEHTSVLDSDGHNVIVLASNTEVNQYFILPRSSGDFAEMSGHCLARGESFLILKNKQDPWKSYIQSATKNTRLR